MAANIIDRNLSACKLRARLRSINDIPECQNVTALQKPVLRADQQILNYRKHSNAYEFQSLTSSHLMFRNWNKLMDCSSRGQVTFLKQKCVHIRKHTPSSKPEALHRNCAIPNIKFMDNHTLSVQAISMHFYSETWDWHAWYTFIFIDILAYQITDKKIPTRKRCYSRVCLVILITFGNKCMCEWIDYLIIVLNHRSTNIPKYTREPLPSL